MRPPKKGRDLGGNAASGTSTTDPGKQAITPVGNGSKKVIMILSEEEVRILAGDSGILANLLDLSADGPGVAVAIGMVKNKWAAIVRCHGFQIPEVNGFFVMISPDRVAVTQFADEVTAAAKESAALQGPKGGNGR